MAVWRREPPLAGAVIGDKRGATSKAARSRAAVTGAKPRPALQIGWAVGGLHPAKAERASGDVGAGAELPN